MRFTSNIITNYLAFTTKLYIFAPRKQKFIMTNTTSNNSIDSKAIIKKMLTKDEYRIAQAFDLKLFAGEPYYNGMFRGESKADKTYCHKECEKRVKAIRKKISDNLGERSISDWIKEDNLRIRKENLLKKNKQAIEDQFTAAGLYGLYSALTTYKMGENVDGYTAVYSDENAIKVKENYEKYSSRCSYMKTSRYFTFHIRKGWNICKVGGLLTFYQGKFDRGGMACEWIEQGKSISDIYTVKGFLVRGEHIEAKSLNEAIAINANHRAMQMARLLNARKRHKRRQQQKTNGTLMITYNDSIASGNCRPGTLQFKQQYEEAIGHEVKSISIADLRKYGKLFGVEYYAERVIEYALNH